MTKNLNKQKKGFTLIEILLSFGVIAIITTLIIIAIKPGLQMVRGREARRIIHMSSLYDAILHKTARGGTGAWICVSGQFPAEKDGEGDPIFVTIGNGVGQYDLCTCIVPELMNMFPVDPLVGEITDEENCSLPYNSGYEIWRDPDGGTIILRAPHAELEHEIGINLKYLE